MEQLFFKNSNIIHRHLFSNYDYLIHTHIKEILTSKNKTPIATYLVNYVDGIPTKTIIIYIVIDNIKFAYAQNRDKTDFNIKKSSIMTPEFCRTSDHDYMAPVYVTISQIADIINNNTNECITKTLYKHENFKLFELPIMVKSSLCTSHPLIAAKTELKINECEFDTGGYFIYNGNEKMIVSSEEQSSNKIILRDDSLIMLNTEHNNEGIIQSIHIFIENEMVKVKLPAFSKTTNNKYSQDAFLLLKACGICTLNDITKYICEGLYGEDANKIISFITHQYDVTYDASETCDSIREYIFDNHYSTIKTKNFTMILNKNDLSEEDIRKHKIKFFKEYLYTDFIPSMNSYVSDKSDMDTVIFKKGIMFALMIKKILMVKFFNTPVSKRDDYDNKKIVPPSSILAKVLKFSFNNLHQELQKWKNKIPSHNISLDTDISNIINFLQKISPEIIQKDMLKLLSQGKIPQTNIKKKDSVYIISVQRASHAAAFSESRKIISMNIRKSSSKTSTDPLNVDSKCFGYIDAVESPEGKEIGIDKLLAISATITFPLYEYIPIIKEILSKIENIIEIETLLTVTEDEGTCLFNILLDGEFVYKTLNPLRVLKVLKENRLKQIIHKYVSFEINYIYKEIRIYVGGGRLIRPLLRVHNNELYLTQEIIDKFNLNPTYDPSKINNLDELMEQYPEVLEYIDIQESLNCLVAFTTDDLIKNGIKRDNIVLEKTYNRYEKTYNVYTHCEIHPSFMYGVISGNNTLTEFNHGPRNYFNVAQNKQGIGYYLSSYKHRTDKSYLLYNTQDTLIKTRISKYVNIIPSGENCIVAYMAHNGFNQEDSLIMNESSVKRGLFRSCIIDKYIKTEKNDQTFTIDDMNSVYGFIDQTKFKNINNEGYAPRRTKLKKGDVIISSFSTTKNNIQDESSYYNELIPGYVDEVYSGYDSKGCKIIKSRIIIPKQPYIGDKFCSKKAQKGTNGILLPQEDMPYTSKGIHPDIIFNPSGIPTRMTIGQLHEVLYNRIAIIQGKPLEIAPFDKIDEQNFEQILINNGFDAQCEEYLYDGETGMKTKVKIFIGPTYYMSMKQLVLSKIYARGMSGPMRGITRLPKDGRKKEGGLKIGVMELYALVSHGISNFLTEKYYEYADNNTFFICDHCHQIIAVPYKIPDAICSVCKNPFSAKRIDAPHTLKLLNEYLSSIGIGMNFHTENYLIKSH